MSTSELCSSRFPVLENRLEGAIAALGPWSGRSPASEGPSVELSFPDRESWKRWAEGQLFEAQRYIDALMGETSGSVLRSSLSDIANELVVFHGYAEKGRADRMLVTLERVQSHVNHAKGLVCGGVAQ